MASARATALVEIHDQLQARAGEFANALPSHIKPEYFQRATLTALSQNQKLIEVDRRSLFNALMRCAQDGLIPDGREAVLVIYGDRERGSIAQYQPMVAGFRKLVMQSGEITRFEQAVAREKDYFDYEFGDHPYIKHKPALDNRGKPTHAYSIAQFRDGTLTRVVMPFADIEKRRAVSRAKNSGPWVDWWEEMAIKTVLKYHAKMLPMSVEARGAFARDDDDDNVLPVAAPTVAPEQPETRPRLVEQFDALSAPTEGGIAAKRERGRPRKPPSETPDQPADEPDEVSEVVASSLPDGEQLDLERTADDWPGPDVPSADYQQGLKDARAGHTGCLNRDIKDNPLRLREWQRGYNTAKGA